jgi:hypothetical protein
VVEALYGDKAHKKMAIYAVIKKVKNSENIKDQHHLNGKKWSIPRLSSPPSPLPFRRISA